MSARGYALYSVIFATVVFLIGILLKNSLTTIAFTNFAFFSGWPVRPPSSGYDYERAPAPPEVRQKTATNGRNRIHRRSWGRVMKTRSATRLRKKKRFRAVFRCPIFDRIPGIPSEKKSKTTAWFVWFLYMYVLNHRFLSSEYRQRIFRLTSVWRHCLVSIGDEALWRHNWLPNLEKNFVYINGFYVPISKMRSSYNVSSFLPSMTLSNILWYRRNLFAISRQLFTHLYL